MDSQQKSAKGLRPGGFALIVKSALVPENLGREVQILRCLGFYEQGEKVDLGGRFLTVKQAGVLWQIRGVSAPLKAMLLRSREVVNTWELAAHTACLVPLDADEGLASSARDRLEKRSEP